MGYNVLEYLVIRVWRYTHVHALTRYPFMELTEKKNVGTVDTTSGWTSCKEWTMASWVSGKAVAVRAIKGALVTALSPPILAKDVLKSRPLRDNWIISDVFIITSIVIQYYWPVTDAVSLINGNEDDISLAKRCWEQLAPRWPNCILRRHKIHIY